MRDIDRAYSRRSGPAPAIGNAAGRFPIQTLGIAFATRTATSAVGLDRRVVPATVPVQEPVGCSWSPRAAGVGVDRPGSVQQRLYDLPGSLYPSEYVEDHPGAINLPLRRLEQQATEPQQPKPIEEPSTVNCNPHGNYSRPRVARSVPHHICGPLMEPTRRKATVTMRLSTRTCHQPLGPSPPRHGAARAGEDMPGTPPRGVQDAAVPARGDGPWRPRWHVAGTRGSRQARPTPRCHAYLRMVTGVPSGSIWARMVMAPLSKRTQPLDTSRPRSLGSAVPCNASWPSPVPNCSSTSE
jgi:hypothetical protein